MKKKLFRVPFPSIFVYFNAINTVYIEFNEN